MDGYFSLWVWLVLDYCFLFIYSLFVSLWLYSRSILSSSTAVLSICPAITSHDQPRPATATSPASPATSSTVTRPTKEGTKTGRQCASCLKVKKNMNGHRVLSVECRTFSFTWKKTTAVFMLGSSFSPAVTGLLHTVGIVLFITSVAETWPMFTPSPDRYAYETPTRAGVISQRRSCRGGGPPPHPLLHMYVSFWLIWLINVIWSKLYNTFVRMFLFCFWTFDTVKCIYFIVLNNCYWK